jgi:mycothiol synthase
MAVVPDLPSGYRIRPPRPDEAASVSSLTDESDAALGSSPSLSEDVIKSFWARPRFDLETDGWVVEQGPTLVGYAEVWAADPTRLWGFGIVHPAHLGQGIGSALATLLEGRAAQKAEGTARLFSAVLTQDTVGARLLEGRGYSWARRFWMMDVQLTDELEPIDPPDGILVRELDPERDLPAAHHILETAFEDHWNFAPTPYDVFLERSVRQDAFDPTLWLFAVDRAEPVGVLSGDAHSDRGWVDELGVLRSHRGRGIATALLRASFLRFRDRGLPEARLIVDAENLTGAVALYERVGMHAVVSYDLWERAIEPEARKENS